MMLFFSKTLTGMIISVQKINDEWDGQYISSPHDTRSRGTAILLNNTFEFTLGTNIKSNTGNYCITELILPTKLSIVLATVYAPNQDDPDFIAEIISKIESFENPNIIIGGDWN